MNSYYNYRFPDLCARCGTDQISDTWEIQSTKNAYDISTLLNMFIGRISYKKNKYTFNVPVCYSCKKDLQNANQAISIIFLLLIIGGFVYTSTQAGIILGLFGGLLGYFLGLIIVPIIREITKSRIGEYDGSSFKFHNKEFMNAFVVKNQRFFK